MNRLMNGWMGVPKNTEANIRGLEQELDACLITVSLFFVVSFFWLCFCPVVLEKRRDCSENPADMKTVRHCFVTFFLNFPLKLPL